MTIHSGIALVLVLYVSFLFLYLDKFSVDHFVFFLFCYNDRDINTLCEFWTRNFCSHSLSCAIYFFCLVALNTDMHIQSENLPEHSDSAHKGLQWSCF